MDKIINVAQYVFQEYKRVTGEVIDEMKLHKLLYFAQRESFAITDATFLKASLKAGNMAQYAKKSVTQLRQMALLMCLKMYLMSVSILSIMSF